MRIATWNINGLKARRKELVGWLRENQIDVVGLQETKTSDERFLEAFRRELRREDYFGEFYGERQYNGVAVLSRKPIEVIQEGLVTQKDSGSRLLAVNTAGLSFTTIYVPSAGGNGAAGVEGKLAWLDSLSEYLHEREDAELPAVLCGDFNIAPEPVDNWDHRHERKGAKGRPGFRDDERSRIRSLREAGWFDLVRHANPDREMFSWWGSPDLYVQNKGLRFDLVFGNRAVFEGLRGAWTDRSPLDQRDNAKKRKDHAPVIVDLA